MIGENRGVEEGGTVNPTSKLLKIGLETGGIHEKVQGQ
jgi:hypothetical protein